MIYLRANITKGMEISLWLKSLGLQYDKDYNWDDYGLRSDRIFFDCKNKHHELLIRLRYSEWILE